MRNERMVMNSEKDQEEIGYICPNSWSDLNPRPPENEAGFLIRKG
jgi:hypothetical protein